MSDSYITIVPANVTREQAQEVSQKAISWLSEREIIMKKLTDCVLGQEKGYQPGQRYHQIIEGDDFGPLRRKTNGLEVVTRRQVFDNGQNGLEEINCPKCGRNNIESEWGEVLGLWNIGENDKLKCVQCNTETSIVDYDFKPTWAFGEFGLTFWNWPRFTSTFLNDLRELWKRDIKVIYGRV